MPDITFTSTALADAYAGVPYQEAIGYKGAATAVTATSVSSGSLPPGLSLVASPDNRITGTPTNLRSTAVGVTILPQTFTFKITFTDTAGAVQSGNYTITVREPSLATANQGGAIPVAAQLAAMWPSEYA